MPPKETKSVIPAGYIFFTLKLLISDKGLAIVEDLLEKADNRNPQLHRMYIYNDFYPYATLDLVDKTLLSLHKKVAKRNFEEALPFLEGLALFMDIESSFYMCDDGARVRSTDKAYGALVVALFGGLEKEGQLDVERHPGLEGLLKMIANWGQTMKLSTDYHLFCRAIGEKLFKNKSPEQLSLEKARQEEWIETLSPKHKKEVKADLKKLAKEKKPWYQGGVDERNSIKFCQTRAWSDYKEKLRESPDGPFEGPCWDITDWTESQKKPFLYSTTDNDD